MKPHPLGQAFGHRQWAAPARQRGAGLLEWMLANSLGLMVTAVALSLFTHQARVALALHQRQLQLQDLGVLAQVLRSELRIAGHRLQPTAGSAYDQLVVEGQSNPTVSYLCDACAASDSTRPAGFRLQSGTLMHRWQSAGSFQALHDAPSSGLLSWSVSSTAEGCLLRVNVQLQPVGLGLAAPRLQVRPRNLGPLPCETLASPAAGAE